MAGKKHRCKTCGKAFQTPSQLIKHIRVHTGERPFKCDLCGKKFTTKGNLESHKRTHSGVKPFQCDVCKRSFSQSSTLQKHKLVHSGAKPFQCDHCSKYFRHRQDLKEHQNRHLGLKPFKCDICEKRFRHHANLWVHKRFTKSHRGVRETVSCEDCGEDIYPGWVPPSNTKEGRYSRTLYGDHPQISGLHDLMKDHFGLLANKCFDCRAEFFAKSRAEEAAALNQARQMTECLVCEEDSPLPQGDLNCHMTMHTRK